HEYNPSKAVMQASVEGVDEDAANAQFLSSASTTDAAALAQADTNYVRAFPTPKPTTISALAPS
ncbi:unnamed protein product, partial [Ilex paraguariensis]